MPAGCIMQVTIFVTTIVLISVAFWLRIRSGPGEQMDKTLGLLSIPTLLAFIDGPFVGRVQHV